MTNRPPIAEIPIIACSQTSPINTPLVHIPHPESVERYVKYKPSTAIKSCSTPTTIKSCPHSCTDYTQLPPLHLPSEISTTSSNTYPRTTSSKLYPPLKPLRKPSTSLSNLLDSTSD